METVMMLYHGTTEEVARKALEVGLLPRNDLGSNGNWEHSNMSRGDMVYLTAAYAPYFALAATPPDHTFTTRWAIVEVDTDCLWEGCLLPDEDFMEQASRFQEFPKNQPFWRDLLRASTLEERTAFFRDNLEAFQHLWEKSLEGLGNCAHLGPIPPEAISRVAIYDPQSNPMISMRAADPSISVYNFKFCGAQYQALTAWFFGESTPEDILGPFSWEFLTPDQRKEAEHALKQTEGLEILVP